MRVREPNFIEKIIWLSLTIILHIIYAVVAVMLIPQFVFGDYLVLYFIGTIVLFATYFGWLLHRYKEMFIPKGVVISYCIGVVIQLVVCFSGAVELSGGDTTGGDRLALQYYLFFILITGVIMLLTNPCKRGLGVYE